MLWDLKEFKLIREFKNPDGVIAATMSNDSNIIVGGSSNLIIWDIKTGNEIGVVLDMILLSQEYILLPIISILLPLLMIVLLKFGILQTGKY